MNDHIRCSRNVGKRGGDAAADAGAVGDAAAHVVSLSSTMMMTGAVGDADAAPVVAPVVDDDAAPVVDDDAAPVVGDDAAPVVGDAVDDDRRTCCRR